MSGKWHLAHADGRRWTVDELILAFHTGDDSLVPVIVECDGVPCLVRPWGPEPLNDPDMVVVWDE